MNTDKGALGEPYAGKLHVQFDAGKELDGHWPLGLSIRRLRLLYHICRFRPRRASPWGILGATNCKLLGIHDTRPQGTDFSDCHLACTIAA